ncbi:cold shock domain-containing protein [Spirillospora sp. NPDC047279]|uniref:cold-shock protein n=1 Tax=Spirillospora sp. NPDC047279 TaxID=3155478 RepID=UPI0033D1D34D
MLRFDEVRGYGFIVPDSGGPDVFVHANELLDDKALFSPGTLVEFEVAESDRGLKAFAVRRLDGDAAPPSTSSRGTPDGVGPDDDDVLCDVLSTREFQQELTELLLDAVPELTGRQIVQLRGSLLGTARRHGWVDD